MKVSVTHKPQYCATCPGTHKGLGFAPAISGPDPKFALLLDKPGETDAREGAVLSGQTGAKLLKVLSTYNLTWNDILRDSVLRCRPGPTTRADDRELMTRLCRHWDTVLDEYNPDVVIISWAPKYALIEVPGESYVLHDCIKKALHFHEQGKHPLIAMGEGPLNLLFPELSPPINQWVRTHFFVQWNTLGSPNYRQELAYRQSPQRYTLSDLIKNKPTNEDDDVPF